MGQQFQTPIPAESMASLKSRMREKSIHSSNNDQLNNVRRRTRSHSRNYRAILSPNSANSTPESNNKQQMAGAKRLLPFDLFLINLRYNRAYSTNTTTILNDNDENKSNFEISKLIEEFLTNAANSEDLDKQERLILNSQNIQVFLEQLCSHKRHIKLENLKSINLNNNQIKRFVKFHI